MATAKKKERKEINHNNSKDETLQSPPPKQEHSIDDEEDDQKEDIILTVQEMYFEAVDRAKSLKGHRYSLYIIACLLLIIIYNATNEQNSDNDMRQVNLNINIEDDFESFLENNPEEFHFNFTNIFIEYQKIQYENTQSSSMRYYISLFDKYVFGSVQDGQIINPDEQKLLNQCIQDHEEMKYNITENIKILKQIKEENNLQESILIRQGVEEMEQYLKFRNVTLNYINQVLNKTTLYYDYYQYTAEKINTLSKQFDNLDTDIIRNELDIVNKNIILIENRQIEEELAILDKSLKEIIIKNQQKLEKTENDKLYEEYIQEDNNLRMQVFEKRLNLQQKISSHQKQVEHYYSLFNEGVKDLINQLIESYFRCIRFD